MKSPASPAHVPPSPSLLRSSLLALVIAGGACTVGDINANGGGDDPLTCEGPLGPAQDPEALTACCTDFVGNAHCLDDSVVPEGLRDFLGSCDGGGYCVPDKFIETGGVFTPKTCASIGGAAGVCLSACVPQVEEVYGLLPDDICDIDEKCVPCVSPIDNLPTGACDIKYECGDPDPFGGTSDPGGGAEASCPHEGPPVIDPATLPACTTCGGGHCLGNALVPADVADRLAACDATSKCVPDELIASAGNAIPETCASVADLEGRCLSRCLPEVEAQAALLPQSTCPATHLCAPCFDPLTGDDTGACRLSCDPGPAGGPETLPACCGGEGTCVPPAAAGADADRLGQDECPEDLLCAPNVFIEGMFVPQECTTGFISLLLGPEYEEGRCLPECLPDVDNFLIGRDGCEEGYKCAPCLNPLTGEPSGACEL
ncbi:MAG TPA: hypothetical protein VML75_01805 [Kofleriaceae bacterium]|nr:hypothetical protein [Kofleriaceae bacterium]